jgi:hypothetical protein
VRARSKRNAGPTACVSFAFAQQEPQTRATPTRCEPTERLPRVTGLLVLAHHIEARIKAGEIRDWAEASRLVGVTRARMTQIANLLLLAADIQDTVLSLPPVLVGRPTVTERDLRVLTTYAEWDIQRQALALHIDFSVSRSPLSQL